MSTEREPWPANFEDALNRLCKWRTVLLGRIVGSMGKDDPHYQGWRDLIDKLIITRVEMTALTGILIDKGICTVEEFTEKCRTEADELDKMYEAQFPGARTFSDGIDFYDIQAFNAKVQKEGWPA